MEHVLTKFTDHGTFTAHFRDLGDLVEYRGLRNGVVMIPAHKVDRAKAHLTWVSLQNQGYVVVAG